MYPINSDSLRSKIYEYLKEQIRTGKLRPGKLINQRELSERLGVSRTPLRDTMIQLEAEGFLSIVPCKGIFIKTLSYQDIVEYFQMGGVLEGKACELALPFFTDEDLSDMEDLITETSRQFDAMDFSGANILNKSFNDIILKRSPNKKIVDSLSNIRQRLYHFPGKFPYKDVSLAEARERQLWVEHQEILRMIKEKNAMEVANYICNVHWRICDDYIKNRFEYSD